MKGLQEMHGSKRQLQNLLILYKGDFHLYPRTEIKALETQ